MKKKKKCRTILIGYYIIGLDVHYKCIIHWYAQCIKINIFSERYWTRKYIITIRRAGDRVENILKLFIYIDIFKYFENTFFLFFHCCYFLTMKKKKIKFRLRKRYLLITDCRYYNAMNKLQSLCAEHVDKSS